MVQWLRLHTATAGGTGSIPGQGTKILHVTQQKKKRKRNIVTSGVLVNTDVQYTLKGREEAQTGREKNLLNFFLP